MYSPVALLQEPNFYLADTRYTLTTDDTFLPPATKLGQGYVFTGVCDSVHRGEYLTRYTPGPVTPPRPGTPPGPGTPARPGTSPSGPGTPPVTKHTPPRDQVHPQTRYPPDQVPPGTRYTPLGTRYTPRPGTPTTTPQPGTPPRTRYTPRDQVHPLGPGTPPGPGRYGLRAGGTHPTGMQSCFEFVIIFIVVNL